MYIERLGGLEKQSSNKNKTKNIAFPGRLELPTSRFLPQLSGITVGRANQSAIFQNSIIYWLEEGYLLRHGNRVVEEFPQLKYIM